MREEIHNLFAIFNARELELVYTKFNKLANVNWPIQPSFQPPSNGSTDQQLHHILLKPIITLLVSAPSDKLCEMLDTIFITAKIALIRMQEIQLTTTSPAFGQCNGQFCLIAQHAQLKLKKRVHMIPIFWNNDNQWNCLWTRRGDITRTFLSLNILNGLIMRLGDKIKVYIKFLLSSLSPMLIFFANIWVMGKFIFQMLDDATSNSPDCLSGYLLAAYVH